MRRIPFPAKKSRLTPQGKTIVASRVLLDVMDEKLDESAARIRLTSEIGLQWSVITAMQYLSGKEAIAATAHLPEDWSQDGMTRMDVFKAIFIAANAVANALPDGRMLGASHLAKQLQGVDWERWVKDQKNLTQDQAPSR